MRRYVALVVVLLCGACSGGGRAPQIPVPPLDDAEPLVRERIEQAAEAVRLAPGSAATWGRLGEIYDVHRYVPQAVSCYRQAQELEPDQWRWPYFAGMALRDSDSVTAQDHLARAAELRPDHAPVWFYLGLGELQAERLDGAETHFRRALDVDPGLVNGLLGLSRVALARGDPGAARELAEQAARGAPDEAAVHAQRAQIYRLLGDATRTAEAERAARSSPLAPSVLGFASLSDPVREELFLREGVSSIWLQRRSAREEARHGPVSVIDDLRRAIELDPGQYETRAMLGGLLVERGAFEEGIELLRDAVRGLPGDADRQHDLVVALLRAERESEALPILHSLVASYPDHAPALALLGTLQALQGRLEESVASFQGALEIEPGNVDARMELARSFWELGRYPQSLEAFARSTKQRPADTEIAREFAWALATCPADGMRDGRRALQIARELCERSGFGNPLELDLLAAALAETGDFATAAQTVGRALSIVERTVDGLGPEDGTRGVLEEFTRELQSRLAQYRAGAPYRQGS